MEQTGLAGAAQSPQGHNQQLGSRWRHAHAPDRAWSQDMKSCVCSPIDFLEKGLRLCMLRRVGVQLEHTLHASDLGGHRLHADQRDRLQW
jgi:hypothetical protein